jgi:putative ABC transport system permease protein
MRARIDDLVLSVESLSSHKLRSGLTLLGIVIGVFTVVSMMSLLNGLQNSIDRNMGGLGADVFQIQKLPNFNFGELSPEIQRRKNLTVSQAMALRELLPQARQVGAEVWEGGKELTNGALIDQGVSVAGGTVEFFTNNNLPIAGGRAFAEAEAMSAARICVLGAGAADVLFPGGGAMGRTVRLGRLELEVIGTIERLGGGPLGGGNPDNMIALPISLFLELYGTNRSVNITVMARKHDELPSLQDLAVGAFRRVRGLDTSVDNDFEMFSNDSARAKFDELAGTVTAASLFICALSLLVGGMGVMNIMLVAVTERTREIGLRKALGARRARVLMQFVIEAVLLACLGGMLGVALGYVGTLVAHFVNFPAEVPPWAVALGLGVSCGIGLLAGIYPAARASRLDPAVALRDE